MTILGVVRTIRENWVVRPPTFTKMYWSGISTGFLCGVFLFTPFNWVLLVSCVLAAMIDALYLAQKLCR
jgi:hypothetical protein